MSTLCPQEGKSGRKNPPCLPFSDTRRPVWEQQLQHSSAKQDVEFEEARANLPAQEELFTDEVTPHLHKLTKKVWVTLCIIVLYFLKGFSYFWSIANLMNVLRVTIG